MTDLKPLAPELLATMNAYAKVILQMGTTQHPHGAEYGNALSCTVGTNQAVGLAIEELMTLVNQGHAALGVLFDETTLADTPASVMVAIADMTINRIITDCQFWVGEHDTMLRIVPRNYARSMGHFILADGYLVRLEGHLRMIWLPGSSGQPPECRQPAGCRRNRIQMAAQPE